jgi:imidazolonepropionase-like amidohydrolase
VAAPADVTRILAPRLIDGRGGPPLERAALLLEESTIRAVGPEEEVRPPDGATVETLVYPDATVLPGLIDTHTHLNGFGDGRPGDDLAECPEALLLLQAARNARVHLETGVTTLRDCGSMHRTSFELRRAIATGIGPGPRLYLCGRPVTITGGHMWYFGQEADGVDGVRRAVRQLVKEGADFVKIVATGGSTRTSYPRRPAFNPDELRAIVDEAHKLGKPTAAHCSSTQGVINALEAGVDTIIHCVFLEPDGTPRFRPEVAERIAASEAWVDFTIAQTWVRILALEAKAAHGEALSRAEAAERERLARAREGRADHFRRLLAMGVRMVSGSDSSWGHYPIGGFQYEVIGHAEWGMSAMDALLTGTLNAARCLGLEDRIGTLEPGKQADLLVVEDDPLRDVRALLNVREVFQAGRRVPRTHRPGYWLA